MPNAKCECCGRWMEDICISLDDKIRVVELVKERQKKMFGIIYKIDPGIQHKEINMNSNCCGVLYYYPFATTPEKLKDFNMECLFTGGVDLDELLDMLKERKMNNKVS